MDLSVFVPPWGPTANADEIGSVVEAAEDLGYHGLWVGDHTVIPRTITSPYPYGDTEPAPFDPDEPLLEPVTLLAFVAGRTSRISIGISVLVLPLRNPVAAAKMLAGIDTLSSGRLVLGVGIGWMREEFEVLGADFARRGQIADEWMDIMRRLWAGSPGCFAGRHYRLAPVGFEPPTAGIPIVIGGNSRAAIRRAARADGWHPLRVEPATLAAGITEARMLAAETGRRPSPFRVVYRDSLLDDETLRAGPLRLAPARAHQTDVLLADYDRMGVDELVVEFPRLPTERRLEWMSWLAERAIEPVNGSRPAVV
jgi:probable F420-dependent oxidoreductase